MCVLNRIILRARRRLFRAVCGLAVGGLALGVTGQVKAQEILFGLTTTNQLVSFSSASPGSLLSNFFITGVLSGEALVGIDTRPSTGELYALGSLGNLYTLSATGAATLASPTALFADPTDPSDPYSGLNGTSFGIDFNPVVDRLRVVSENEQNLRINADTGATFTDTPLSYPANPGQNPNVVGSAYSNNFDGATTTTLYGIDSFTDSLVIQNPANNGTLSTVGSLGITGDVTNLVAFDISGLSGIAYAALQVNNGFSGLYIIDLSTGRATPTGFIGSGLFVAGVAFSTIPEPSTFALFGLGAVGLLLFGKRAGGTRKSETTA